ncbi:LysE family translocator [Paraburkholderia sp. A1RI_3L]|uniref:LysE family translocator n=1 Tax=Paraburkholderia TaxID=1822464 RepID=UPI003B7EF213
MFGISDFPLFVGAVMLLNVTPGPDMAYVAGQSIAHGRRAGILSALGVSVGGSVHTLACALGLSALIAASPAAFTLIKWVGAIYLVYLGLQMVRRNDATSAVSSALRPSGSFVVRGIVSNVTNPKVLLFYIAFLPQFVNPDSHQKTTALLILGATLVALGFLTDCIIVYGTARASGLIRKRTAAAKWLNRIVGTGFIGLGFRLATSTR